MREGLAYFDRIMRDSECVDLERMVAPNQDVHLTALLRSSPGRDEVVVLDISFVVRY